MKKKYIKTIRITLLLLGIVVVLLLAAGFLFGGKIAEQYLNRKIRSFNSRYPATLAYRDFDLRGLNAALIRGISLKPHAGDTLLTIDSVYVSLSPGKLLFGSLELKELSISDVIISLTRHDSTTNYMFLLKGGRGEKDTEDTVSQSNYASMVSGLFNAVFDRLPSSMDLNHFRILVRNDDHLVGLIMDRMSMNGHFFRGPVRILENNRSDTVIISGLIDKSDRSAGFRIYSNKFVKVTIPFIEYRWHTGIQFDTLSFSVSGKRVSSDLMNIRGYASMKGLIISNEKIATEDILFENLGIDYSFNFGKDYAEMDSSTLVTFNQIDFHPYIRYRPRPTKQLTLSVHKPDFPAQQLFSSIPRGLFSTLDDIRVRGTLSYNLDFFVDFSNPDSLYFDSEMKRKGFGVVSFGSTPLTRINEPFLYTAYEKGQPVRSFMVGPVNPDFRYIDRISPYLKLAVLTGEDPSFYQHGGFLMDAFRESIATNIKQNRFARGGSTISMQMVKNVFLSRNKTIGRKVEEMLITWLIESQRLSSKDRIFEVYLNVIEWGPMIYGANEAAQFYFGKDASRLTLSESIFLGSIVPHPKWWRSSFTPDGRLRPSMTEYYRLVSGKMLRKGQISQWEYDQLRPEVELTGRAGTMFASASADTLSGEDEEGFFIVAPDQEKEQKRPSFFRRLFGGGKDRKKP